MVDRTVQEVLDAVTAESTRVDSLIAYSAGLKQRLDDALAGVTLPPAVQTKINAIFDMDAATAARVDVALNAGVPPPPTV